MYHRRIMSLSLMVLEIWFGQSLDGHPDGRTDGRMDMYYYHITQVGDIIINNNKICHFFVNIT